MPVVPTAVAPSVAPTPNSGLPYQNANGATPDAFGASIGTAESNLGAQVGAAGDMLEKHALKMQEDVNASSAKDLFLAGDVAIGKLTVDYNSLEGANRVNAYPKYVEDIGAIRAKYKQLAPNDDVAKRFDQDFARRVGYSIVDGARSAATANKQYQKETSAAVIKNGMEHIAANAGDDNRFETELKLQKDNIRLRDDYKGQGPEKQAEVEQEIVSGAWSTRLASMAKTDPLRARELFKKNKDSIDGITQLKLDDTINQQIINVQSRVDSDKIIQSGALVDPALAEKIKRIEGYTEKPYADFKQTSSGYGTKAQPGDENIPPEQRRAVYEQRLYTELGRAANIVDNFAPGLPKGTRDALISLTYNAGSSWTSSGLGSKIRSGDLEGAKDNFGRYTSAGGVTNSGLVNRRAQELSWWGGEARDSDPVSTMGAALEKAKEQAIKTFPDDLANQAKYLDTLQNRIKSDFSVLQSSARDMQLQTRNIVQKELFDPDHHVTSYDRLSPQAKQAYDLAPPVLQKSFDNAMEKNATADVPRTPERADNWDKLYGLSTEHPDQFMALDISNQDLTRADKSRALKMQADKKVLLERGAKIAPAMTAIDGILNAAQITKKDHPEDFHKFKGIYETSLNQFMQEKKREANPAEAKDIANGLIKDIITGTNWYGGDSRDRAYRVIADKTPITINGTTDEEIAAKVAAVPRGATVIVGKEKFTKK